MAQTFFERVEAALGAGTPKLVYQPLMRYSQREILGLEALFRWHLASSGELCTPVTLFPQLQPQHTSELFFWVLDQASLEMRKLSDDTGYQGFVSVNMEADQLGDPDLWSRVQNTLEFHELSASRLVLEITERRAIPDFPTVQRNLKAIARSRVRLAMDDFGEGFASLDYVRQLQPAYLKLSGQMTRNMPHDSFNTAVVRLAVGFAQATSASLVVEGVEWAEQAKALADMGVRDMQGYLFGKPAPIDEWARLLKRPVPEAG